MLVVCRRCPSPCPAKTPECARFFYVSPCIALYACTAGVNYLCFFLFFYFYFLWGTSFRPCPAFSTIRPTFPSQDRRVARSRVRRIQARFVGCVEKGVRCSAFGAAWGSLRSPIEEMYTARMHHGLPHHRCVTKSQGRVLLVSFSAVSHFVLERLFSTYQVGGGRPSIPSLHIQSILLARPVLYPLEHYPPCSL